VITYFMKLSKYIPPSLDPFSLSSWKQTIHRSSIAHALHVNTQSGLVRRP
jgi:hypothetical protein